MFANTTLVSMKPLHCHKKENINEFHSRIDKHSKTNSINYN